MSHDKRDSEELLGLAKKVREIADFHAMDGDDEGNIEASDLRDAALTLEAFALQSASTAAGQRPIDVLEAAAKVVEKMGHDYMHEHGSYDASTNAWDIHHRHADRLEALDDAVAAIRAMQKPEPAAIASAELSRWVEAEKAKADAYEAAAVICEEMSYPPEDQAEWHGKDEQWAAIKLEDAAKAIRERKAKVCQVTQAIETPCTAAFTGLTLRAGKTYRNGHGDLRGPLEKRDGVYLDQYGCAYRANGHQYSHHIESAGNLVAEVSPTVREIPK